MIIKNYKKKAFRKGLTLVDVAMAMLVAAVLLSTVLVLVADAQGMRKEAERISLAVALAQAKLSQLLSNPELESMKKKGMFDKNSGIYSEYEWEIEVREETIDLAKVAESGELESVPLDDKLPEGIQNESGREKMGQGAATQTGGMVDIIRIIINITYPRGGSERGEYRVETFRGAKKTSS